MREIKFRARRADWLHRLEWVYGNLLYDLDATQKANIIREAWIREPLGLIGNTYRINISTIGQFTGFPDKNGKEIYEGDICNVDISRYDSRVKNKSFIKAQVVWYESGFILSGVTQEIWESERIEVIGNIYDNPELLK